MEGLLCEHYQSVFVIEHHDISRIKWNFVWFLYIGQFLQISWPSYTAVSEVLCSQLQNSSVLIMKSFETILSSVIYMLRSWFLKAVLCSSTSITLRLLFYLCVTVGHLCSGAISLFKDTCSSDSHYRGFKDVLSS